MIIRPGDKTSDKIGRMSAISLYAQEMAAVALRQQATAPGASPGERAAAVTKAVSVLGLNYPSAELAEWAEKTLELTSTPEGGAIVLGADKDIHTMSRKTLRLLQEVASLYDATERFLAIRLEMRTADGTRLLSGGGIWDKRLNRWRTPEHLTVLLGDEIAAADQETLGPAHILTVEASQVEYVQAFGQWLKSYKRNEPRPSFVDVLALGKRRGGKTWVMVA